MALTTLTDRCHSNRQNDTLPNLADASSHAHLLVRAEDLLLADAVGAVPLIIATEKTEGAYFAITMAVAP